MNIDEIILNTFENKRWWKYDETIKIFYWKAGIENETKEKRSENELWWRII